MPRGRLTLSWAGKDEALLNTPDGGYQWVARDDPRVTEVRLLEDIGECGEVSGTPADNLLIQGDSYDALQALVRTPEYAKQYRGKVKLIYIDPPFNTGQAFEHYNDALEHSVWLTMMRDRLLLIRELLAPDGSVWVHLDDAEMAYCKVLLDEIFGRGNFVSNIIWNRADSPRNSARHFSVDQDYILIYARNAATWRPNRLPRTAEADVSYKNPDDDPRGPWIPGDPFANNPYSLGLYEVTGPTGNRFSPPPGRYWRISKEKFRDLDRDGRIWWRGGGEARPRIKRYLSEVADLVPRTVWDYRNVGSTGDGSREIRKLYPGIPVFSTPKPERLLERILQIGSNAGDIVLDCFAGSGTTAAVAHKMDRRWVTIEMSTSTIETFTQPRLERVVAGDDPGGITKSAGWSGGGGFRSLRVAPSAWELAGDRTLLAVWATGEKFGAIVAAQLGFTYDGLSSEIFCGHRGRSRLAVIDGVADENAARAVLSRLDEGEHAVIVGRGVTPEARNLVRELDPGSKVLKAPRDLVARRRAVR